MIHPFTRMRTSPDDADKNSFFLRPSASYLPRGWDNAADSTSHGAGGTLGE